MGQLRVTGGVARAAPRGRQPSSCHGPLSEGEAKKVPRVARLVAREESHLAANARACMVAPGPPGPPKVSSRAR